GSPGAAGRILPQAPPMAALTLAGVYGIERNRTPVALNTAFEIAEGTTEAEGSPAPQGGAFGWLISSTVISGMSGHVRIGCLAQSRLLNIERSNFHSC